MHEIFIYPVEIKQDYYQTQTPYMYQIKSGDLSRFFLPGSYLGNRLVKMIIGFDKGRCEWNPPIERPCKALKRILEPNGKGSYRNAIA